MKKIVCLVAIVLLIGSVVFAAQKAATKISEKNLASLQGSWEGMMSFGEAIGGGSGSAPVKLEILSGTVPVKGKLTIQNVPDAIARAMGISGGTNVVENNDGTISSQGALVWAGENKSFLKVSLSGEKKMRGTYYFRGIEGDMSLTKK